MCKAIMQFFRTILKKGIEKRGEERVKKRV